MTTAQLVASGARPHVEGDGMKLDHATQPDDLYWDPFDYELHADPHPLWRRMREEAPLYRNESSTSGR